MSHLLCAPNAPCRWSLSHIHPRTTRTDLGGGSLALFSLPFPAALSTGLGKQHPSTLFSSTLLPPRCDAAAEVGASALLRCPLPRSHPKYCSSLARGEEEVAEPCAPRGDAFEHPAGCMARGRHSPNPSAHRGAFFGAPLAVAILGWPYEWRSARRGSLRAAPPGGNPKAPQSMLEGPNSCLCRDSLNSNLVELAAACGREPGRGAWHAQLFFPPDFLFFFFQPIYSMPFCTAAWWGRGPSAEPDGSNWASSFDK